MCNFFSSVNLYIMILTTFYIHLGVLYHLIVIK